MGKISGGYHAAAAGPETPKFPEIVVELSFRHDCTADQRVVGFHSTISYSICPAHNRKGVHSKIKLFVAAWTPTLDGMMVVRHNSLLSCAVGESAATMQAVGVGISPRDDKHFRPTSMNLFPAG